jgi:hypothetical protein
VPFPPHVGDKGYLEAFQRILAPVARPAFAPNLILLSLGFDARRGWTPLASMGLSLAGYAALVQEVMVLADEGCAQDGWSVFWKGATICGCWPMRSWRLSRCCAENNSPQRIRSGSRPQRQRPVHALFDQLKRLHNIREKLAPFDAVRGWLEWDEDFGV